MLISVVIPTYHEQGYLLDTLIKLNHQSFKDYEIILSDYPDAENSTPVIVEQFKSIAPWMANKISIIEVQQTGIGRARNEGVKNSRGDIICDIDADSYYSDNDGLAKMVRPIISGEAVMTIPFNSYYDGNPVTDTSVAVSNVVQYVKPFHLTGSCILKNIVIKAGGFANENVTDELGRITGFIQRNGLPLKIVNDVQLIKSARRVNALVANPLSLYANIKDFSVAYR